MYAPRTIRRLICAALICSIIVLVLPAVAGACTNPTTVYRLYNKVTGEHFYTSNIDEKHALLKQIPTDWVYEGVGYEFDGDLAVDPLYRFYNLKNGTHFYTASTEEMERVKSTLGHVYKYEGPAFNVSKTEVYGAKVYRFYNKRTGSHFYTANESEKYMVINKLGSTYTFEGQAYYLPE
ncbi:hypothetical protein EG835_03150 [bacterium]|nr:hypothetical protein [bacterium]